MSDETSKKLAVLIDADNAQASLCNELFSEVSKYGLANVKRAYGDWTTTNLKGWKEHLHKHAIQPIQQFSYTTGKNSTDSSLIIDAMDLLHDGNLDGFCLISSDSDFTRLANRLRESGIIVYGFGEEKTPDAFISACNLFIKTENLRKTKAAKDF
ncbi:NYN domain-containing protein, partial [Klebsiella pneumoniae]